MQNDVDVGELQCYSISLVDVSCFKNMRSFFKALILGLLNNFYVH